MIRLPCIMAALRDDSSGLAVTEFALIAPFLFGFSLYAFETTSLTITHMRVNQVAVHIADHASRIGEVSDLDVRKIYETDINDLLRGADLQAGGDLDLYENGRVILSSLEVDSSINSKPQWLHWQRCKGVKNHPSSFGNAGDKGGRFNGMGPRGNKVKAEEGEAVMFVEVAYDYQPLFADWFLNDTQIVTHAAFNVRSDRDLSGIQQQDPDNPADAQSCDKNDSFAA